MGKFFESGARTRGVSVIIEASKVADVSAIESPVTAKAVASARPLPVNSSVEKLCNFFGKGGWGRLDGFGEGRNLRIDIDPR